MNILHYPNKLLTQTATPVETFDQDLQTLVEDLEDTMALARGVGLAAPQVGVLKRVFVVRLEGEVKSFVNPVILERSERTFRVAEGCLSIPGVQVTVERAARVEVKAYTVEGEPFDYIAEGFQAAMLQHEYDHLDGTLTIDYLSRLKRRRFEKQYRKRRLREDSP